MSQTTVGDAAATVIGRDAGVAGRLFRLVGGAALLAGLAAGTVARGDARTLEQAPLYFGLELVVYVALLGLLGDRLLARIDPWLATFVLWVPGAFVGALGIFHVLPAAAAAGSTLYVGVGLVVMSATGYGGCEVISLPNALLRRRQIMYCPYNAVDLAERAARLGRLRAVSYGAGLVALAVALFFLVVAPGSRLVVRLASPVDRHLALLLLAPAALFAANGLRSARAGGWRLDRGARASLLGAAAIGLAACDLSGVVPQSVTWPLILIGGMVLAVVRIRRRDG